MLFDQPDEIAEMNYIHFTQEKRYQIYALKKVGLKQSEIASVLERSTSTISRELARNCGRRRYRSKKAYCLSLVQQAMNSWQIDDATWQIAQGMLWQECSPEQICVHLLSAGQGSISRETIY